MKKKLAPETGVSEPETSEQDSPKKYDIKKILNIVVNVILVIAIILAAVCTYVSFVSTSGSGVPSILGVRPFTVQSDSMYPALQPGDLIIDTAVKDPATLKMGDIVTYWTIIDGERVLNTHRITGIYDGGTYRIFETKGDRNTIADPLTVHESEIVGKFKFRIPGVGKVLDYLQTSTGFLIVIVLPVLLFFIFHLVQFFRVLFEYQNVKMLIKYEQERGRTEDLIESQVKDEKEKEEMRRAAMESERAAMEAELREKLRAEMLAEMAKNQTDKQNPPDNK
ncbi:MAG: signal peptidase I [Clostridia bacterium]|nr:signal peptidase I [Clostridia bacterium]